MIRVFALAIVLLGLTAAYGQNEQAPLQERELAYKDWNYKNVKSGEDTDLRDFTKGKKLVMVAYFAPWCPNWRHDVAFVEGLYEKYRSAGFDVIGVGEYDPVDSMKTHIDAYKITFPVVYESAMRSDKQKTPHYEYRKQTGDTRNWGSPWYIFLEPAKLEPSGEILTKRTPVVNGELIKPDIEKFIRERLGFKPDEIKNQTAEKIEACEPESKAASLTKP